MLRRLAITWIIGCSLLNSAQAGAIVGGKQDNPVSWPGVVMVRANSSDSAYGYVASCGGSLVAAHWVLTAAHCLDGKPYAFVSHGKASNTQGDWIRVSQIYRYPGWNSKMIVGDLALLRLPEEWSGLQPLLWSSKFRAEDLVRIMGWGATSLDKGKPVGAGTFRSAWTTIHTPSSCRKGMRPGYGEHTLCAGDTGRNICNGDSGGPLMIKSGNVWKQIGIASFGSANRCGASPGYFTDINYYRSWISSIIVR